MDFKGGKKKNTLIFHVHIATLLMRTVQSTNPKGRDTCINNDITC